MFKAIKEFFLGKTPEPVVAENPPYKVEEPTPVKCGCGRSPTGNCVGLHKLTADEWAVHVDNPNKAQPVVEAKVDAVSVALDLEPVDLAATPAEPAKKPRKPRAPKVGETAAKTAKAADKKAAKPKAEKAPKKPAVIKAKKAK